MPTWILTVSVSVWCEKVGHNIICQHKWNMDVISVWLGWLYIPCLWLHHAMPSLISWCRYWRWFAYWLDCWGSEVSAFIYSHTHYNASVASCILCSLGLVFLKFPMHPSQVNVSNFWNRLQIFAKFTLGTGNIIWHFCAMYSIRLAFCFILRTECHMQSVSLPANFWVFFVELLCRYSNVSAAT